MMSEMVISKSVISHGLFLGEDDEKIVLALTKDPDNDTWFSAFAINKPNIVKVSTWRVRDTVQPGEDGRYFPDE